jgi:hypothetical protein
MDESPWSELDHDVMGNVQRHWAQLKAEGRKPSQPIVYPRWMVRRAREEGLELPLSGWVEADE